MVSHSRLCLLALYWAPQVLDNTHADNHWEFDDVHLNELPAVAG